MIITQWNDTLSLLFFLEEEEVYNKRGPLRAHIGKSMYTPGPFPRVWEAGEYVANVTCVKGA
jgi:hypothetical protein